MSSYIHHKETRQHPSNPLLLVEFEAHEEYSDPTTHFDNLDAVRFVINEQNKGNTASWFSAKIYVRVAGTEVKGKPSYLGCCSYKSFDEFLNDQYFHDLTGESTDNLMSEIERHIQAAKSTVQMLETLKGSK